MSCKGDDPLWCPADPDSTLSEDDQALVVAAASVRDNAWAPYSKYKVGAALRSKSGEIYTGCNVENATFGATTCAERNAIAAAIAAGAREFDAIAVVTHSSPPAMPCGICRQVLAEFGLDMRVLAANSEGSLRHTTCRALLPEAFSGNDI